MIESITFNTAESKITVTYDDGTTKDYADASAYLADHPDRANDVQAMGWEITDGWQPPPPEHESEGSSDE